MKILISKNEILNNYDWEKFCELLKNEIDINKQNDFVITFEQAEKLGIIKNQNLQFQNVYKNKIVTDCYTDINDALEDIESYVSNNNLDKDGLSIEVLIKRDFIRKNGGNDTRLTLENLCKEYLDKEYLDKLNTLNEMEETLKKMKSLLLK